jgi:hypothetical protein
MGRKKAPQFHDFRNPIFATVTAIEQQEVFDGQIRYKLVLEDVPLECMEYTSINLAIKKRLRLCLASISEA